MALGSGVIGSTDAGERIGVDWSTTFIFAGKLIVLGLILAGMEWYEGTLIVAVVLGMGSLFIAGGRGDVLLAGVSVGFIAMTLTYLLERRDPSG